FDTKATGGASLIAGSYFGSNNNDNPTAIAVRGTEIYLTGTTGGCCHYPGYPPSQQFPLTQGAFTTCDLWNSCDAGIFMSAIDSMTGQLVYSSVFGSGYSWSGWAAAITT